MQEVYERIARVAPTSATVFLTGESGSGKEVVARTIHENSTRAAFPFLAVNCGAIPTNLIEAELFGYEKCSFTGAARMHRGCFERAEGGTLFLDEVTEMAPEMQVRLLRVLEIGRYARVGGEQELRARARISRRHQSRPPRCRARRRPREDLSCIGSPSSRLRCRRLRERDGDPELPAERLLPAERG
jgi:DNA-binding NtrC family response regulator